MESPELQGLDSSLELELQGLVLFDDKIEDAHVLHMTVNESTEPFPATEMVMLRLVCVHEVTVPERGEKEKRILFSYDFVTHEILNREESLDLARLKKSQDSYLDGL